MLTPDEVRYVVEDSGTRAVVASADKGEPLLDLRGAGNLQDVVLWGDEIPAGATAFADWLSDRVGRSSVRSRGTVVTWRRFATRRGRPAARRARCSRSAP